MFTNLRTLFLTVRSKFLSSFLVHSTPCVSTPVQVFSQHPLSWANNPISAFSFSSPHLSPHSPIPAKLDHCHCISSPENIVFSRPSHKVYGKEPSTCAGNTWIGKMGTYHPAYIERLQASAHCCNTLPAWCLKNILIIHICDCSLPNK